ncbi:MAG: serpin family protein [Candidatus Hydrothermales bacterium]
MKKTCFFLIFLFFFYENPKKEACDKGWSEKEIKKIADSIAKFTFNFYFKLKDKEENVFFSPFSIASAFLIVYEGARENTKREIENVFGFPEENIRRPNFARIFNEINRKDKKYTLYTANALWIQKNYKILKEYKETIKKYYISQIENLDFVKDAEKSRQTINSWVFNKTKGKIKDLIPRGGISYSTKAVITNAVYFKGNWFKKFDEKNTREEDFYITKENKIKVQMMRMEKEMFKYFEDDKLQALEIPYEGEEIFIVIFLPKLSDINSIDEYLNYEKFKEIKEKMKIEEVDIYLPKFKTETNYLLKSTLFEMGIKDAFSEINADFSGISGKRDLFISDAYHKAFVEINEEGTEAAAATGIVMEKTAIRERKIFKVDRPFVFLIYNKKIQSILFFGRIINPL